MNRRRLVHHDVRLKNNFTPLGLSTPFFNYNRFTSNNIVAI